MKRTAVVICPGRGTYNATELGYLQQHFPDRSLLSEFDRLRLEKGQVTLADLDGTASFSLSRHGRGDNAAALIYAATIGDYLAIDREQFEIAAVTGNSMGWYSALACSGAVSCVDGFRIANTMGTLMQKEMIGGQLVYPWMDEAWTPDQARRNDLLEIVQSISSQLDQELYLSIDLGGILVLAGNEAGLRAFERLVPIVQNRFPMRLGNHAAFHTVMQEPVAKQGRAVLPPELFGQPQIPLIDGRGAIWWPGSTNTTELWDYTLNAQITQPYDFTRAVTIAAREFAPDVLIITGPGTTLGGAVAQSSILSGWKGWQSKADFQTAQKSAPVLLSMGMPEQRLMVVSP